MPRVILGIHGARRCGRVAEGDGLLNRYTLSRCIEGSNPSVSAKAPNIKIIISLTRVRSGASIFRCGQTIGVCAGSNSTMARSP